MKFIVTNDKPKTQFSDIKIGELFHYMGGLVLKVDTRYGIIVVPCCRAMSATPAGDRCSWSSDEPVDRVLSLNVGI